MKISYPGDCANSPRKCFLIELHRAYAECDFELLMASASKDIVWSLAGQWRVEGRDDYESALQVQRSKPVDELTIEHVITHGREAAVSGRYRVADHWYRFADIYVFTSTTSSTLKSVQSMVIGDAAMAETAINGSASSVQDTGRWCCKR